jgi:hypothetical protein
VPPFLVKVMLESGQTVQHIIYQSHFRRAGMIKSNPNTPIKVIIINPPTKEQADKRIKELVAYLESVWLASQSKD